MLSVRKVSLLVALASTCGSSLVLANSDVALDDLVVTGTRSETALLDLAGNTGKVSEEEIDLVRADHITEVINRIPGVMVQRGSGQEHLTAIRSPVLNGGAGAGSFLFMQDGIPLRAAGFANANGLFEVNSEQAGAIEVVRGPGSALYGSNAVHGLVNVLTRAPSQQLERIIDVSAGPHDLYGMKATVSNTYGEHGYRLSVNGKHDGGYIDKSGFDQQKMTFRHDYLGDVNSFQTVLSVANLNQETAGYLKPPFKVKEQRFEAYKDSFWAKQNMNPEAYRNVKSARLSTRWDHELSNDSYFSVTPYLRHSEMDFLMHWKGDTDPIETNEHQSAGVLLGYYRDLPGGHKVIMGTDFEFTKGKLAETQIAPTQGGDEQGTHYDYEVDATVIAPYIHTEWQLTERTRATIGARFEHTRYDYDNKAVGPEIFGDFQRPSDREDTFNNFSPKFGITQYLTDDTSAFINLARGNRAPQTTDLYRMQEQQNGIEADSEKMDSIEIGVRDLGDGFQYEVSAFFMKKKDYFFRDSNSENVPNGKTRHYGIELGAFLPIAEQFDIAANFTYAVHEYDFDHPANGIIDGNDMDTAPRHLGNVRFGWNFKANSRAELEWIHVGRYYTNEKQDPQYEGHDLLNLRVNHSVNNNVTVYGRVTNLLDTKYAERADNFFGDRYYVGEERALHVGASYSF